MLTLRRVDQCPRASTRSIRPLEIITPHQVVPVRTLSPVQLVQARSLNATLPRSYTTVQSTAQSTNGQSLRYNSGRQQIQSVRINSAPQQHSASSRYSQRTLQSVQAPLPMIPATRYEPVYARRANSSLPTRKWSVYYIMGNGGSSQKRKARSQSQHVFSTRDSYDELKRASSVNHLDPRPASYAHPENRVLPQHTEPVHLKHIADSKRAMSMDQLNAPQSGVYVMAAPTQQPAYNPYLHQSTATLNQSAVFQPSAQPQQQPLMYQTVPQQYQPAQYQAVPVQPQIVPQQTPFLQQQYLQQPNLVQLIPVTSQAYTAAPMQQPIPVQQVPASQQPVYLAAAQQSVQRPTSGGQRLARTPSVISSTSRGSFRRRHGSPPRARKKSRNNEPMPPVGKVKDYYEKHGFPLRKQGDGGKVIKLRKAPVVLQQQPRAVSMMDLSGNSAGGLYRPVFRNGMDGPVGFVVNNVQPQQQSVLLQSPNARDSQQFMTPVAENNIQQHQYHQQLQQSFNSSSQQQANQQSHLNQPGKIPRAVHPVAHEAAKVARNLSTREIEIPHAPPPPPSTRTPPPPSKLLNMIKHSQSGISPRPLFHDKPDTYRKFKNELNGEFRRRAERRMIMENRLLKDDEPSSARSQGESSGDNHRDSNNFYDYKISKEFAFLNKEGEDQEHWEEVDSYDSAVHSAPNSGVYGKPSRRYDDDVNGLSAKMKMASINQTSRDSTPASADSGNWTGRNGDFTNHTRDFSNRASDHFNASRTTIDSIDSHFQHPKKPTPTKPSGPPKVGTDNWMRDRDGKWVEKDEFGRAKQRAAVERNSSRNGIDVPNEMKFRNGVSSITPHNQQNGAVVNKQKSLSPSGGAATDVFVVRRKDRKKLEMVHTDELVKLQREGRALEWEKAPPLLVEVMNSKFKGKVKYKGGSVMVKEDFEAGQMDSRLMTDFLMQETDMKPPSGVSVRRQTSYTVVDGEIRGESTGGLASSRHSKGREREEKLARLRDNLQSKMNGALSNGYDGVQNDYGSVYNVRNAASSPANQADYSPTRLLQPPPSFQNNNNLSPTKPLHVAQPDSFPLRVTHNSHGSSVSPSTSRSPPSRTEIRKYDEGVTIRVGYEDRRYGGEGSKATVLQPGRQGGASVSIGGGAAAGFTSTRY